MSKQINFKVSDKLYEQIKKTIEIEGFETTTDFIEECVRFYLNKDEYYLKQKEFVSKFLKSDEGKLWFSAMLDEELLKRAMPRED